MKEGQRVSPRLEAAKSRREQQEQQQESSPERPERVVTPAEPVKQSSPKQNHV